MVKGKSHQLVNIQPLRGIEIKVIHRWEVGKIVTEQQNRKWVEKIHLKEKRHSSDWTYQGEELTQSHHQWAKSSTQINQLIFSGDGNQIWVREKENQKPSRKKRRSS